MWAWRRPEAAAPGITYFFEVDNDRLSPLFLTKGAGEAVCEGMEKKGKHSSLARDDSNLDRHSGVYGRGF